LNATVHSTPALRAATALLEIANNSELFDGNLFANISFVNARLTLFFLIDRFNLTYSVLADGQPAAKLHFVVAGYVDIAR
jgi:hypothetical protein